MALVVPLGRSVEPEPRALTGAGSPAHRSLGQAEEAEPGVILQIRLATQVLGASKAETCPSKPTTRMGLRILKSCLADTGFHWARLERMVGTYHRSMAVCREQAEADLGMAEAVTTERATRAAVEEAGREEV